MCTEQSAGNGVTTAEAGAAKPMVAAANAVAADRAKVIFFISTPFRDLLDKVRNPQVV